MKVTFKRFGAALMFAAAVAMSNPLEGLGIFRWTDGNMWRAGCVELDRAEFLVDHLGFSSDGSGTPMEFVKCATGLVGVSRMYGH